MANTLYTYGNSSVTSPFIELFELDATGLNSMVPGGATPSNLSRLNFPQPTSTPNSKFYITNSIPERPNITTNPSASLNGVTFNGNNYMSFPLELQGVDAHGDGTASGKPVLTVANTNQFFLAAILSLGDLIGVKVTRIRTFYDFCDFGSNPDVNQTYPIDVWVITQKSVHTKSGIQWNLSSYLDRPGVKLPRLQIFTDAVAGQIGFPGVSRILQ